MNANASNKVFTTTNKNLEVFLYAHKIRFFHQRRLRDRMNCWYYEITPRFQEVLKEFFEIWGHDAIIFAEDAAD